MGERKLIVDYLPFEVSRDQIKEALKMNNGRGEVQGV